jgi:hypothetical protein
MLHFLGVAVGSKRLAGQWNTKERTCLRPRVAKQRTATSFRLPLQAIANIMDLDFEIFDSER